MFKEVKPNNDEEWLKLRTTVLTASDIGAVLGLNKWKSVSEMWKGKQEVKHFENYFTYRGQQLEAINVQDVNKILNRKFKLFENGSRSFFLDDELRLGATPDAGEGQVLLECKSTKPGNFLNWKNWPPAYYLSQLYVQLYCTERQEGLLSIMPTDLSYKGRNMNTLDLKDLKMSIFELHRTSRLDEILETEVKRFWDTINSGKMYRVDRKQAVVIEILIRMACRRIR